VGSGLEEAKADLGAAEAPEGVDAGTAAKIERAIDESFVAGFRTVMVVSAGLALASALAAALLVGDGRVRSASRDPISRGAQPHSTGTAHRVPRRGSGARGKESHTHNRQPDLTISYRMATRR
jgi:hypothetical protein